MQQERRSHEDHFSANYEYPLHKNQLLFCRTAKQLSIFQKIQRITVEQSISTSAITQFDITSMTERLKSTISPRIISQPTYSQKHSDPQNITRFALWSVYATATKHLTMSNMYWIAMAMTKRGTRRFFSEYAAMQRVSHHRIITVSIKDFSYLDT